MLLNTYDGRWVEVSACHPEMFTVLAPEYLQSRCKEWGGKNLYGRPRFRLALVASRFEISGGDEITVLDGNKNFRKRIAGEVFLRRYHVPESYFGTYVLEQWRSPQWYYEHGYGGDFAVEYSPAGKMVRKQEPVWPEGGYEAVWWDLNEPFVFPRNLALEGGEGTLRWAIFISLRRMEMEISAKRIMQAELEAKAAQEKVDHAVAVEINKNTGHPKMFLEPTISMVGAYREMTVN